MSTRTRMLGLLFGALGLAGAADARNDGRDWVPCAREGQTCHVPGPAQVRFGANGHFVARNVDGPIDCTTAEFGDPARHVPKVCEYRPEWDHSGPQRGDRDDRGWEDCAKEGEVCRFRGQRLVRFGADGAYNMRRGVDRIDCSIEQFGDPVYGVRKSCQVRAEADHREHGPWPGPQADGRWTRCADEGQTCNVPISAVVRFGVPGDYHYRQVSGSVRCDSRGFGDPRPGVLKACDFAPVPMDRRSLYRPDADEVPALDNRFWDTCASEFQDCRFRGEAHVRFGANGVYRVRYARDGLSCDTRSFGGDPTPNTRKQCAVYRP